MMGVRDRASQDTGALCTIFFRGVREGAARAYSEAERLAWAPVEPDVASWEARLEGLETLVDEDGTDVRGFMSWRPADGYIDLAYVLPEVQGKGVADALYAVLENRARAVGLGRLWSHASHMAKPFFGKHGWTSIRPNAVERRGVILHNWIMEKPLI